MAATDTVDRTAARYPISFDSFFRPMSAAVGMLPSRSFVEVTDNEVTVRMGWGFKVRFPRSAVKAVTQQKASAGRPVSRGVHGFKGRWLVNGSARGIVDIDMSSTQRGAVMGFPVKIDRLQVSVVEPERVIGALEKPA